MICRTLTSAMRLALAVSVLAAVVAAWLPPTAQASGPDQWHRGFLFWNDGQRLDDPTIAQSLYQLQGMGTSEVSPVVDWYVANGHASDLVAGPTTPSDEEVRAFVQAAHSAGLRVMLTLHVNCLDGTWRGFLKPQDTNRWFAQYQALLEHYATLAEELGVEGMVVGAELVQLSGPAYTGRWEQMIAAVRSRYHGFLTYSANWGSAAPGYDPLEEFSQIQFWSSLDYLGLAAYFNLSGPGAPSRDQLLAAWQRWYTDKIAPFQARFQKPLLLTEVGYRSTYGAASRPWDPELDAGPDLGVQAELYNALFEFWQDVDWLLGIYVWYWTPWPNLAAAEDYPVQGKRAAEVVAGWFRRLAWPAPNCPIGHAVERRCTGLLP